MADPVFYLKYRPQKIAELDLREIRERLKEVLSASSIPHAFLFSGPKGLGKTSAARIVAKAINCRGRKREKNPEPCNRCSICRTIARDTCLDLIEIDAASNRGIDDIRELKERIKLAPAKALQKIYVIDEVHMLTAEAFNALLKTLEEPPAHAFFILCTTEPWRLPATIISRCQRFNFKLAKKEEIIRSLKRIVKGEKLKIDDGVLAIIAAQAEGSFRDAAKLLQQLSFNHKKISLKQAQQLLEKEAVFSQEIIRLLAENKIKQSLLKLKKASSEGLSLKVLTQEILEEMREILLAKHQAWSEKKDDYGLNEEGVKKIIILFDRAGRELRGAVIPSLPLELAVIEWGQSLKVHQVDKLKSQKPKVFGNNGKIEDRWQEVLRAVKKDSHNLEALLKSTRPQEIKDDRLVVEVFYQFHREKLEKKGYRKLVQKRINQVFGRDLELEYKLKEK